MSFLHCKIGYILIRSSNYSLGIAKSNADYLFSLKTPTMYNVYQVSMVYTWYGILYLVHVSILSSIFSGMHDFFFFYLFIIFLYLLFILFFLISYSSFFYFLFLLIILLQLSFQLRFVIWHCMSTQCSLSSPILLFPPPTCPSITPFTRQTVRSIYKWLSSFC